MGVYLPPRPIHGWWWPREFFLHGVASLLVVHLRLYIQKQRRHRQSIGFPAANLLHWSPWAAKIHLDSLCLRQLVHDSDCHCYGDHSCRNYYWHIWVVKRQWKCQIKGYGTSLLHVRTAKGNLWKASRSEKRIQHTYNGHILFKILSNFMLRRNISNGITYIS